MKTTINIRDSHYCNKAVKKDRTIKNLPADQDGRFISLYKSI